MDILLIKALLIFVITGWLINKYISKSNAETNNLKLLKNNIDIEEGATEDAPIQKDEYQILIDNVEAIRGSVRQIKQTEINNTRDRLNQAFSRLDAIKQLSEDLGIDDAIILLSGKLKELHVQDSWEHNHPKNLDGDKVDGIDDLYYISGSNVSDKKKSAIIDEFKFKENQYILTIAHEDCMMPDNEMCRFADVSLRFFDGGEYSTVFSADAEINETYYDLFQMKITRVTNIKLGDWISDIVQIHELLKAENEKSSLEWRSNLLESKIKI